MIRDRTGLDGDGQELVGKAFGGPNPLLKVNKLQTESERNVQKGIQFLLMGLYQGIRNPRSHGKHVDSVEDADTLILFVDFLLKIIDRAKAPFEAAAYLERVFDPSFVESDKYAEPLVAQIPANKRWDILVEVYRLKEKANGQKLAYFMSALVPKLTSDERDKLCSMVSEELMTTNNDSTIRSVLQIVPLDLWHKYSDVARIRTEGRIIDNIRKGRCDLDTGKCVSGGFSTWAINVVPLFVLKDQVLHALRRKLGSSDPSEQEYVFHFFMHPLRDLEPKPSSSTIVVITNGLKAGDKRFYTFVGLFSPDSFAADSEWFDPFKQAYDEFKENVPLISAGGITDDEVPF
jgi:uncharacterized protein (TIGR02391 family)